MIETIIMLIIMLTSAVLPSSLDDFEIGEGAKGNYTYSLDDVIDKNQSMLSKENCSQTSGPIPKDNSTTSTIIADMIHNEIARFCYK